MHTFGRSCDRCDNVGELLQVGEPYPDLDACHAGFGKGAVVFGSLSVKASAVEDILLVDGRGIVVGKGFPVGQFSFGFDPAELFYWKPRNWIGFVSGRHLSQIPSERGINGVVRLRKFPEMRKLIGGATMSDSLTACQ